ncbi:MAG: hypothetical protein RL235_587, partial [Chlamydiota bacterium]
MSPYWNCDLFDFFKVLFGRLLRLEGPMASDEVQLCVLVQVAIACGILGPFLVLKRQTMFANALSHTMLFGIAITFLLLQTLYLPALLIGALVSALLTALLTQFVSRLGVDVEASLGLVFTFLFAIGVSIVSVYIPNAHLGVETIMGSVDALQRSDIWLTSAFALFNGVAILFLYSRLKI